MIKDDSTVNKDN